jgi:mycothiol synthase
LIKDYDRLDQRTQDQIFELISAASDKDGIPPVSEHILLHLRHGGDKSDQHLIAFSGDQIAGYAHLDLTDQVEGPSAELVVHPQFRQRGIGSELIVALKQRAQRLRLWSHGDLPGAQELARKNDFHRIRTVIQMRRSLNDPIPVDESAIEIRPFAPGLDNKTWLALNNRAFLGHPEQGNWSARDLDIRLAEEWSDPRGFLLAFHGGVATGFCWTKIHGGHSHQHSAKEVLHDHDPIGEIYIMGVDPDHHGKGIGRALTIAGLKHIRQQRIFSAMLYVDELNSPAIALYSSLGFTEWGRDVLYRI